MTTFQVSSSFCSVPVETYERIKAEQHDTSCPNASKLSTEFLATLGSVGLQYVRVREYQAWVTLYITADDYSNYTLTVTPEGTVQ